MTEAIGLKEGPFCKPVLAESNNSEGSSPVQASNFFAEKGSRLDTKELIVLRTIGNQRLRVREAHMQSADSGLSLEEVQYALGTLFEAGLIAKDTNGFDCVYVVTKLGHETLEKHSNSLTGK